MNTFGLPTFDQCRVMVVGDIMLDRYLLGDAVRISPEAPVPIVRVRERFEVLGGAGNVANNLSALQCPIHLVGLCGDDSAGKRIKRFLADHNISSNLLVDKVRPTIVKTRIMARDQQLLRLDEEETSILDTTFRNRLLDAVGALLSSCHVLVLSDYGKGIFQTPGLCQELIDLANSRCIPVLIDPKGNDWKRYHDATCVTPNKAELELVAGLTLSAEEELVTTAQEIRKRYGFKRLLVTRGSKGMCLVGDSPDPLMILAKAREVYDVSGAGDTVIAVLAAALASGLPFDQAAIIANTAAGVAVSKLGTQPVTLDELHMALYLDHLNAGDVRMGKLITLETAQMQVKAWRAFGEKVVFTNGCFDLLHPGHVHLLQEAKSLGDRLVVGLNSDSSVRRLKGTNRPVLCENDRATLLSALACVDKVIIFQEDTPLRIIETLRPDILVKGSDYRREDVVGADIVEGFGGKVCLVSLLPDYSTTAIMQKTSARS